MMKERYIYESKNYVPDSNESRHLEKDGYISIIKISHERTSKLYFGGINFLNTIGDDSKSKSSSRVSEVSGLMNLPLGEKEFLVHSSLHGFIDELKHSLYILDLEEDWDGMGAVGISKETYYSAVSFAVDYTKHIFRRYDSKVISTPEINPCVDGTVDVEWHGINARFLANVQPSSEGTIVKYYGDFHKNESPISGKITLKQFNTDLAKWMTSL